MIDVLIADDHPIFLDGITSIIAARYPDIRIVSQVVNGLEAVAAYKVHKPDVVLLDIRMPVMNGVDAAREILSFDATAKILILTTFDEQDLIEELFSCGVYGYLLKETPIDEVVMDIRLVQKGQTIMNHHIMEKLFTSFTRGANNVLISDPGDPGVKGDVPQRSEPALPGELMIRIHKHALLKDLGMREKQIFLMILQGKNNTEISTQLNLSAGTVRNYIHTIYNSIDVHKRSAVIIWAIENKII